MIEPAQGPVTRRPARAGRVARALAFGVSDYRAPLVALAGFLLRGGIVLLVLPSVMLPSILNIAGATGVDAISIAGQPTPWAVALIIVAVVAAVAWLAVAFLVGSLLDVWLIQMAGESGRGATTRRLPLPAVSLVVRLVAIRIVCLLPLAGALAWAATRIFTATYDELITPSNLSEPLLFRVVQAAGDAVAVVVVVWLAAETIAAIAIRRQVLAGSGIGWSLAGAAGEAVRRPISTLVTVIFSYATSALAIGLALVATSTAFDWFRLAARNQDPIAIKLGIGSFSTVRDFRPVAFGLAAVALALAWAAALTVSAVTSAWRSAAFTNEVVDDLPAASPPPRGVALAGRLGLSGGTGERSGD